MVNIKDLAKELPSMEHEFEVDVQGAVTGIQYKGTFRCKIPNVRTQAMIAKHKAFLNGGFDRDLDLGTLNLHHMISYLRYTLIQPDKKKETPAGYPDWWHDADLGYELFDINVIEAVYQKVLDFEQEWTEKVWGPQGEEEEEPKKEE